MKAVSVGFIGAGFSANLHARSLAGVHGVPVRLAAVAARHGSQASAFAAQHGIPTVYANYDDLLADPSIDVVCVCVPNVLHAPVVIAAAKAGKHLICEKPMTGAFGQSELRGAERARDEYARAMETTDAMARAVQVNGVLFCYAENWVYAPTTSKIRRLLELSQGPIIDIRAEESHSGSHAPLSRRRDTGGGGALLMLGSHAIAAAIHLKNHDAALRGAGRVSVATVTADVAALHESEAIRLSHGHEWLVGDWHDVETWANTVLAFSDGTRALITASFAMLGGVRNTFEVYTTNAVFQARMTPNDSLAAYTPDADAFGDEYLHEKIETRTGWISTSPDEDWVRGYPHEMQDFAECVAHGREPLAGIDLARDVVRVVYASYLSAEEGRRVTVDRG